MAKLLEACESPYHAELVVSPYHCGRGVCDLILHDKSTDGSPSSATGFPIMILNFAVVPFSLKSKGGLCHVLAQLLMLPEYPKRPTLLAHWNQLWITRSRSWEIKRC